MQLVPIQPVPSQVLTALLTNQACQINVYQKNTGLFCDLYVNALPIVLGVICQNRNRLVRAAYLGFVGDMMFIDTQGLADPVYAGLGSQFVLAYLDADDIGALDA